MLHVKKILPFMFLISVFNVIAQDIPEPDFSQKPYFLKDGKLVDFEKVESSIEGKGKGMGFGGVEMFYSAKGLKSSIRLSGAIGQPVIIVKMEDGTDPADNFTIIQAQVKKDIRRFITGKAGGLGGAGSTNSISFSVKKIRDKVYELTFQQPLLPGEYAIIPVQKNASLATASLPIKMNCFGID